MRLRYRDFKKIMITCAAILFLIGVHILSVYIFAVHQFTVSYDDALSEKAQVAVEDFIRTSGIHRLPAQEFSKRLQETFPFVRKVTCTYAPNGLQAYLKVHAPFVRLQQDQVVTCNNYCVSADYFAPCAYRNVPQLSCALSDNRLPEEVYTYLCSIDPAVLKNGRIDWRHSNEIVFCLPDLPMHVMCSNFMQPTSEIISCCTAIAQDLQHPQSSKLCADLRFNDRIVVTKLRNEGV